MQLPRPTQMRPAGVLCAGLQLRLPLPSQQLASEETTKDEVTKWAVEEEALQASFEEALLASSRAAEVPDQAAAPIRRF